MLVASCIFAISDDLETQYTTDSEDQRVIIETLEDPVHLRPITPTGSLSDSDPDMELGRRFSPLAVEEVDLPHTPGGCLELEDDEDNVLPPGPPTPLPPPPSPTGIQELPSSPFYYHVPLLSSYPGYEETPKTPGRVNDPGFVYHSERITPPREPLRRLESPCNPFLSSFADSGIPRTPGRGMSLSPPVLNHREINVQHRELLSYGQHHHNTGFAQSDAQTNNFSINNSNTPHLDTARLKRRRERLKKRQRMIELQRTRRCTDLNTHSSSVTTKPSSNQSLGPLDRISNIRTEETDNSRQQIETQRLSELSYVRRDSSLTPHLIFTHALREERSWSFMLCGLKE